MLLVTRAHMVQHGIRCVVYPPDLSETCHVRAPVVSGDPPCIGEPKARSFPGSWTVLGLTPVRTDTGSCGGSDGSVVFPVAKGDMRSSREFDTLTTPESHSRGRPAPRTRHRQSVIARPARYRRRPQGTGPPPDRSDWASAYPVDPDAAIRECRRSNGGALSTFGAMAGRPVENTTP